MKKIVIVFNYPEINNIPEIMSELSGEIIQTIFRSKNPKKASCIGELGKVNGTRSAKFGPSSLS